MTSDALQQVGATRMPSEVLGAMAHELRQPLSAIESIAYYLSLVLPREDEKVQRHLNRIRQLVEQANCILTSGVRVACSTAPSPQPLDLEELITRAIASGGSSLQNLHLALSGSLPPVHLDPNEGRTLVDTLLTLFRPLAMADCPVTVRTSARLEGGALLEMEAPELRSESALGAGVGLLESARLIAEAHGGMLESETGPASGIRVRVMLP